MTVCQKEERTGSSPAWREAFDWLPEEGLETLGACFDLTEEHIPAGEIRRSGGRIGCLLKGRGRLRTGRGERVLTAVHLLGISVTKQGERRPEAAELEAEEDCTVLWFDFQLVQMVCYAACWFHVRFLQEIDRMLEPSGDAKTERLP